MRVGVDRAVAAAGLCHRMPKFEPMHSDCRYCLVVVAGSSFGSIVLRMNGIDCNRNGMDRLGYYKLPCQSQDILPIQKPVHLVMQSSMAMLMNWLVYTGPMQYSADYSRLLEQLVVRYR